LVLGVRAAGLVLIGLTLPSALDCSWAVVQTASQMTRPTELLAALGPILAFYATPLVALCLGAYLVLRDAGSIVRPVKPRRLA
jgi:hypothetical protein